MSRDNTSHYIRYIIILTLVCTLSENLTAASLCGAGVEITKAVTRLVRYGDTLFDSCHTEKSEKLYAEGTMLYDVHSTIDEIIPKYGYPLEKFEVITEDGYILTLFRIPSSGRPSVLLMHGLLQSSDDWVTPGPDSGIAYLLADQGYDVWLGNARGNKHSRRHRYLSPETAKFWDFSWDEMGRYDLPAIIDFILSRTLQSQIIYVGHSQGTTTFFVMASERQEYNNKISLMIALAPAGAIPNLKSPVLVLIKYASLMHPEKIFSLLRKMGFNEFLIPIVVIERLIDIFVSIVYGNSEIIKAILSNAIFLISGFRNCQFNVTNLPVVLSHSTSGATKQIEHYAQTVTFRRFQKFDYGAVQNLLLYGSITPPEYDLKAITTPLALIYSPADWLAAEADTLKLRSQLTSVIAFYKVPTGNFSHLDFILGKDVKKLIIPRILRYIEESRYHS